MVQLLFAAAALAAALPDAPPAAAPAPDPAMFIVRDADTTVFIFGTFHALDGEPDWFNAKVRSAFDSSSELVLETLVPDPAARSGVAVVGLNTNVAAFRPLPVASSASFLGTTRMAITAGRSQGMSVGNGADMVLRRAALDTGKEVEGLETLESQLAMFSRMPMPKAPAAPASAATAVAPMERLSQAMGEMQVAWKHGDQRIFGRMIGQLRMASPDAYRMMFTERNARWADWVAARMQTPGTVFVAVGAGHLVGDDSLLVRLAQLGIESQRVQ